MLRFPSTPQFRVHYKSIQSKVRHSKLTLRVTEAASAVCGITFHPNGMDGGLTTVTLTLLLYITLPRLTRFFRVGGVRLPTFTISSVSPKTHPSANPRDIQYLRWATSKHLKTAYVFQWVYIEGIRLFASHACHLVSRQKVTTSPPEIAEWFIG